MFTGKHSCFILSYGLAPKGLAMRRSKVRRFT